MKTDESTKNRIVKIVRKRIPESNLIVAKTLLAFAVVCFAMLIFFKLGIIKSKGLFVDVTLVVMPIIIIISSVWCIIRKGTGYAFQYVFLVLLAVFWLLLELMSGYKCKLLLPVLIVLSLRYYNHKFTIFTYVVCVLSMLGSVFCNAYLYDVTGFIDLNLVSFDESFNEVLNITYDSSLNGFIQKSIISLRPSSTMLLRNGLIISFFPNMIFLTFVSLLTTRFMRYNLYNIVKAEETAISEANHRLELSDLKTKVVLSQVKPHFLYNTLSSIASLCCTEPKKAEKMTVDFANYLRNNLDTLNNSEMKVCTFETELEHIKSYLNIELVRFENELNVVYDTPDVMFSVPVLSIQPIVENAVKHGVSKKVGGGTVKISTREVQNGHEIIISDNGIGFNPDVQPNDGREHIGITNIKKRISMFGGTVKIQSEVGVGTEVVVFIPSEEGLQK